MARVTIEDCIERITNRFQLILLVSKRAQQILKGAKPLVALDNDKPVILALREVAAGLVDEQYVKNIENELEDLNATSKPEFM